MSDVTEVDEDDFSDLDDLLDEEEAPDPDNELIDLDVVIDEDDMCEGHPTLGGGLSDCGLSVGHRAVPEEALADGLPSPPQSRLTTDGVVWVAEPIRRPLISGHCAAPQTRDPELSHRRCKGYSRANPDKIFQPCPCSCHFPEDRFECECGATLAEAPHYPVDEDGDIRYVHVNPKTGRMVDGECPR